MKKLLFLITSILAISSTCVAAGCNGNQSGPDAAKERSYVVGQQDGDQTPDNDNDCPDGDFEDKKHNEGTPEFKLRPYRHHNGKDKDKNERGTDDEDDDDFIIDEIEPIRPHKKHPHDNHPAPRPMPIKPKH
ncbi:MAG: hypothetical protein K2N22_05045 [Clostridia bacterium]|nr:hypothetical protein [Clostridia bacterium]